MDNKITITQAQLTQLINHLGEISNSLSEIGKLLAEITEENGE